VHFAPGSGELLDDVQVPVIIVEAEKSDLALRSFAQRIDRSMLLIAPGGCWAWKRKTGNRLLPDGGTEPETGPSPDFDLVKWQDRQVVILADSNIASNRAVQKARRELAKELTGRGAQVFFVDIPVEDQVNGPDDYLGRHSDADMTRLLESAKPFNQKPREPQKADDQPQETQPDHTTDTGNAEYFTA
jgi:hypothetical protein